MYHDFSYEATLASSLRAQWRLDDVLRADQELDFSRNFLPESLARTAALAELNPFEQRILNQIAAHEYLSMFGIIEEFILPFLIDHAQDKAASDQWHVRALLNFAGEEAKHIHLFRRFHEAFNRGFPVACKMVGPSEEIGAAVLRHDPLAVGLAILMVEWMTQQHYLGSIRNDAELDPLFKSLMKHHWMEEAQHAKLDTLIVEELAAERSAEQVDHAVGEFLEIGEYLDALLKEQASNNLDALEQVIRRKLPDRAAIAAQQHQAARWTYLGTGLTHPTFVATLQAISPLGAERVAEAARAFG